MDLSEALLHGHLQLAPGTPRSPEIAELVDSNKPLGRSQKLHPATLPYPAAALFHGVAFSSTRSKRAKRSRIKTTMIIRLAIINVAL